jgi:hypothetical protein
MARNWQYPRWRRLLMQSAMWVILGGTVGLAALLDRHQQQQTQILLAAPLQCGDIRLQLPAGWETESSRLGMVTAREPSADPFHRELEVTVAPAAEAGLVDQLLRKEDQTAPPRAIWFGAPGTHPGNLYVLQGAADVDGQPIQYGQVIATAVLAHGPDVTIRLEHLARNSTMEFKDDIDLVRRIAATVEDSPSTEAPDQD